MGDVKVVEPPDRIYLQLDDGPPYTHCADQINCDDVEYIRLDVVRATGAPVLAALKGVGFDVKVVKTAALLDLQEAIGPPMSPEEVDEILREAGYDPAELGARMSKVAQNAIKEQAAKMDEAGAEEVGDAE